MSIPPSIGWGVPSRVKASSDDHEDATDKIAESMCWEITDIARFCADRPMTVQLSAGIDSAVVAAAAKQAGVDFTPVHFSTPGRVDESVGARRRARFLGKKVRSFCRVPQGADSAGRRVRQLG